MSSLSGDYYTEASIDTGAVPLDPLFALYLPSAPQGFQGETELHANFKGPLKDKSRIEAHVTIPTLKASYQSLGNWRCQPDTRGLLQLRNHSAASGNSRHGNIDAIQGSIPVAGTPHRRRPTSLRRVPSTCEFFEFWILTCKAQELWRWTFEPPERRTSR